MMRIGLFSLPAGGMTLADVLAQAERAEAAGLHSFWLANIFGLDALTTLALAGQRTRGIELGTFVVPTFPRHPFALAQQALTVQAATGNRLALGIGLGHRATMQERFGFDWDHPIRHLREYLNALVPLLAQQPAHHEGLEYTVRDAQLGVAGAKPPQVLVAALGEQMLTLTGRMADGTAIWMGGVEYLRDHAVPTITTVAAAAGRPAPRVVASVPVCVTRDAAETAQAREQGAAAFARYGMLPSYRAILDKAGAAGPMDVALIGSADEVRAGILRFFAAGATDFAAAVFTPQGSDPGATWELLAELANWDVTIGPNEEDAWQILKMIDGIDSNGNRWSGSELIHRRTGEMRFEITR